ncbi:unnamed protein product [Colletotrichum noveboracense]|uniref:Celp0028 effector like protein n=1 Tax=Colletotrichum noveboracense TaxID=2664923 RepID=A0A9W4S704_9PEZI|nr:unnamed protein product [Colletotrichum noveboracense]
MSSKMRRSFFIAIFSLLSAAAAAAVAVSQPAPYPLRFDDVVAVNEDGSHRILKTAEYDALLARVAPKTVQATVPSTEGGGLARRDCGRSTEVQVESDEEFLNWDVAISPILSSHGGTATVSVAKGYSVGNSVSLSSTANAAFAKVALSISLSVNYAQRWTTSDSQTLSFTVPEGQHGLVVSQPLVRRVTGRLLTGCSHRPTSASFTSDTYTDQSFGNLDFVKGVIRLCNSTVYPVPYCNGQGFHY